MIKYNKLGVINLEERKRGLSISEMLYRAFYICKNNAIEILKVIGIFIIPILILPVIVATRFLTSRFIGMQIRHHKGFRGILAGIDLGLILAVILAYVFIFIGYIFVMLVITKMLDDSNKGYEVSIKSAMKYVWDRKWRALGLSLLVWFILLLVTISLIVSGILVSIVTLGIGAIIVIPAIMIIVFVSTPVIKIFNSVFIVNDLSIMDTIKETIILIKNGFWPNIGKLAAISGISIGASAIIGVFEFIPILGVVISSVGIVVLDIYVYAYLNIFVLDRNNVNKVI